MKKTFPTPETKHLQKVNLVIGAYGTDKECVGVVEWTEPFNNLPPPYSPKEGGTYTKYIGCSYLFKGYPKKGTVDIVGIPKKMIPVSGRLISESLVLKLFLGFLFLSRRKLLFKICDAFIEIIHSPVAEQLLPPEQYCNSVRELHRASEVVLKGIRDKEMDKRIAKLRDCGCMSLEYDAAYKFPFQDAFSNFDKVKFKEDLIKEIRRVFNIMIDRQILPELADKWRRIAKVLILILRFSKQAREWAIVFFSELDYAKIELDEDDRYFCLRRANYNYWGSLIEERKLLKEKIDKAKGHKIPKVVFQQVDSTQVGSPEGN